MSSIHTTPVHASPIILHAHLEAMHTDLLELEQKHRDCIEQEELQADVQCLRTWIESYQKGELEAAEFLNEHGAALLEDIKTKLQTASREIQRIDEESPVSANFNGGESDRLNKAAETVAHAQSELTQAFGDDEGDSQSPVIAK